LAQFGVVVVLSTRLDQIPGGAYAAA
jgi:hypothetical protein